MIEDFPSNSRSSRPVKPPEADAPAVEEKNLDKVVTGKVVRRKKSLGRRFVDTFFTGSSGLIGHVVKEVLVPDLQTLFLDIVRQAAEKAIYGDKEPPRSSLRGSGLLARTQISYDRLSTGRTTSSSRHPSTVRRPEAHPDAMEIGEFLFEDQINAQVVADKLFDALRQYDAVTVAELNSWTGHTSVYTDHKYGWTDLSEMSIKRIREGYLLLLPNPEPLR